MLDTYDAATAIAQLSNTTAIGGWDEEILEAANFVFRFGSLGEHFEQQDLGKAQSWPGPPGAAWALIGHWSVQRHDPTRDPGRDFQVHRRGCETCVILEDALAERALVAGPELDMGCEDCGGGINAHAIIVSLFPFQWHAEAVCVGQWQRAEPAVTDEGAGVFDDQASPSAYSARWWAPLADGAFAVVSRYYYLVNKNGGIWLAREDEYVVCSDLAELDATTKTTSSKLEQLESDYPLGEDLAQLARDSFAPEPDEWERNLGSVHFAVPALAAVAT